MVNKSYSLSLFTMAEVRDLPFAANTDAEVELRKSLSEWIDNPVHQVSASVIVTCNLCEYRGSKQRLYNCKGISLLLPLKAIVSCISRTHDFF